MSENIHFSSVALSSYNETLWFLALHNTLFPNTDITREWIDWYMRPRRATVGSFDRDVRVYGAYDGTHLVGIWCVEQKALLRAGEQTSVGRCFAVGIDPNYRRRNIFVELSKYAIACERNLRLTDYILGFPQAGKPVIDAHLKSGWERVQEIEMYSLKPRQDRYRKIPDSVKNTLGLGVAADYDGFVCDDIYRLARWEHHPYHHYIKFSAEDGSYIVLKPYGDACHVLEVEGDPVSLTDLFDAVEETAYRHKWSEITVWCAHNELYKHSILEAGYKPGAERGSSVELLAVRTGADEPLQFSEAVHFQMGIEEIY